MRFNLPRLIGITGKAGTGKDTLADYLVRQHGFVKYSLASPIKKLLNERFGWTDEDWQDREWKEFEDHQCGYQLRTPERMNHAFSPRSWAQWLGTEAGRTVHGENCWVDLMEKGWRTLDAIHHAKIFSSPTPIDCPPPCMVVPDIRFDNEARRIQQLGGVVIRVARPDAAPVAEHASEQGVSNDFVNVQVTNNTDIISYLREAVYALEQSPRGV